MSVVVRPAQAGDIDGVCDLLHGHMSAKIPRARWRLLLDYPWRPQGADRGRVAVDGDRVVGFLGLVYADRPIAGRLARFCNIGAWYLLRDYRGQGIGQRIQRDAIADPALIYTLVTATAATERAFRRDGFATLDDERALFRRRSDDRPAIAYTDDPQLVERRAAAAERTILRDHRACNLRWHLLEAEGETCILALQVKRKGDDVNYHEVMHASDRGFLQRRAQAIADRLLDAGKSVLAIDRRFLADWPPGETERIPQARLYRGAMIAVAEIDNLYNEIALLDLKLP